MKRVLINVEDRELRIAILENDQLTELYIESLDDKTILNNVYKGRVEGVLPGLSAAFVNIGFERNAFLHFDDVRPDLLLELKAKREGRELPAPEIEIPPPPGEAEEETYEPTPEELEVVTQLQVETPPEVPEPVAQVVPQSQGQRRRRRGRRGGRNRRKNRQNMDLGATSQKAPSDNVPQATAQSGAVAEVSLQEAGVEGIAQDQAAAANEPSAPRDAVPGGQPQQQSNQWRDRQRQKSKRQKEQRGKTGRRQGAAIAPPGTIRGTRAATNPYDVFSPFALPKKQKQKSEKPRRRKAQRATLDHLFGPTTLPPDVPIEKDSQLDFFGPAEPATTPPYDEPVEERVPVTTGGTAVEPEFLDEANGNVAEPGNVANQGSKRRGQRRTLRRKGPAQYAVRRRKSDLVEEPDSPQAVEEAVNQSSKKSSRTRSRKKVSSETLDEPTASQEATEQVAQESEPETQAKPKSRRTSERKKKSELAAQVAGEISAGEVQAEAVAEESVKKTSRRTRKKEKTTEEPTAATATESAGGVEEPAYSPEVGEEPVIPAAGEKVAKKRSSRRTARRKKESPEALQGVVASQTHLAAQPETESGAGEPFVAPFEVVSSVQEEVSEPALAEPADEGVGSDAGETVEPISAQGASVGGEAAVPPSGEPSVIVEKREEEETAGSAVSLRESVETEESSLLTSEGQKDTVPVEAPQTVEVPPSVQPAPLEQTPPAPEAPAQVTQGYSSWRDRRHLPKVHEVLRKGDEILVQVTKEEIGGKGARISTYISLPGRYLVLLPYGNNEGGVSRRVESYEERRRLKRLQRKLRHDLGILNMGLIIRTAGMERSEHELRKDAEFLLSEWRRVQERAATSTAPALVYDDSDILYRLCRDVFDESIDEIIVDNAEYHEKIRAILQNMIPELVPRLRLYQEPSNLFVHYGVDEKIRKAGRRKVWLKSGGYIIIDEAEALTAIDVNTGKFVGKDNQEQMILKTNLEAAQVIARELKLRDIGGIIVIDFIDMRDPRNRETLLNEFRALLRKDHAKTAVSGISEFGLVEMTRKRVRQSLRKTLFTECPYCKGSGVVLSEQQIWVHLKNVIVEILEQSYPRPDLVVQLNPTIKEFVEKHYQEVLDRLEQRYGVRITLHASDQLHMEHYHIEKKQREGSVLDTLISLPDDAEVRAEGS